MPTMKHGEEGKCALLVVIYSERRTLRTSMTTTILYGDSPSHL